MNAVISTNERAWISTGHVTFKLRYNQIYQMKTSHIVYKIITYCRVNSWCNFTTNCFKIELESICTYFYILYTLQFWIEFKKRKKEEKLSLNSQIVFSYLFFTLDLIRQSFSSKYFFSIYGFLALLSWENGRMKEITNSQSKKNSFTIYFYILTKKDGKGRDYL